MVSMTRRWIALDRRRLHQLAVGANRMPVSRFPHSYAAPLEPPEAACRERAGSAGCLIRRSDDDPDIAGIGAVGKPVGTAAMQQARRLLGD
jgi:hypothetical protein